MHAMKLVEKYGGLKWNDEDEKGRLTTAHTTEMHYITREMNKGYHIVGIIHGFNNAEGYRTPINKNYWLLFDRVPDFYKMIVTYYQNNPNPLLQVIENGKKQVNESTSY